jgi:biopolymer transport protein ExbB/TolQ
MENIFEYVPYILMGGWLVFSIFYLIRAKKRPEDFNPYIFESIPQVFPTIGILGTFIGIAVGLWNFDVDNIESSIPALLSGLKTAFIASIAGIVLSVVFAKFTEIRMRKNEKGKLSPETIALNNIASILLEMKSDMLYTDANGNKINSGNANRVLMEESKKQSAALLSFSTDLAAVIEAGFEKILNDPDKGVVAELQAVKMEIVNLGTKLQDPAAEMTKNVVNDLQSAMGKMIDEFKTSMSGSTKSELENLTALLIKAGGSLTDFPNKLQEMTDNLNQNFKGLQNVVNEIALRTREQSEDSNAKMRAQVEAMSGILFTQVGGLQRGQEELIQKQTGNLEVSDKLLQAFNTSIEKMNALSVEVGGTMSQFSTVKEELNYASSEFKTIASTVNSSANTFKESQLIFSQYSNQFLDRNASSITEIQNALEHAKVVSKDFSEKFELIEKGLQGIFGQVQTGLNDYSISIGASMESYLKKYSEALTQTAESLSGAASKQEEILEELTEQISKFNSSSK